MNKLVDDQLEMTLDWVHQNFEKEFVELVVMCWGEWVSIPLGDPNDSNAPIELQTQVPVHYQQGEQPFCLGYSVASALVYCGFAEAAHYVAKAAKSLSLIPQNDAVKALLDIISTRAPEIGRPLIFGKRLNNGKKRPVLITKMCDEPTKFPTLIFLVGGDASLSHAVCMDDIVFDSTQKFALKLKMPTMHWVCGEMGCVGASSAYRFQQPSTKLNKKYDHQMVKNW